MAGKSLKRKRSAEEVLARMRVGDAVLKGVGAVTVLTASLEFWTERAVWTLKGITPAGTRPETDGKPITQLITKVEKAVEANPSHEFADVLRLWSDVARTAMKCRNSLVHGLPFSPYENGVVFGRNLPWDGVQRQREYSDFHADEWTLHLLADALAALVLVISFVAGAPAVNDKEHVKKEMMKELRSARSTVNELVDLAAAVNHEKY